MEAARRSQRNTYEARGILGDVLLCVIYVGIVFRDLNTISQNPSGTAPHLRLTNGKKLWKRWESSDVLRYFAARGRYSVINHLNI